MTIVGALFGLAVVVSIVIGVYWGTYFLTVRFLSPWPLTGFVRRFTIAAESLLRTNMPLVDGLERSDIARWGSPSFYRLQRITSELRRGASLAEALHAGGRAFGGYYVEMVEIGERSGKLPETFGRLRRQGSRAHEEVVRLCAEITYPLMVSVSLAGIVVVAFIMIKIIPQFQTMFSDFDVELPTLTQLLVAVSEWIVVYWSLIVLCITVLVMLGGLARATRGIGRRTSVLAAFHDGLLLLVPGVRGMVRDLSLGRAALAISQLTAQGAGLAEAVERTSRMKLNLWLARGLALAAARMNAGVPADEAMRRVERETLPRRLSLVTGPPSLMEPMLVAHTRYGLRTGDMSGAMRRLAQMCFDRFYVRLDALADAVAPAWTLVNGIAAGFVCLGLFMPLVELMNKMGG